MIDQRWLPSRPSKDDPGTPTGPKSRADDPSRPAVPVRAVCCSGGGIRSAAFSLGGLQHLNSVPDGDGETWLSNSDLVVAVSGGSYIASAYATVQHGLKDRRPDEPRAFEPGSPEDNRLRTHTRYLIDSSIQFSLSLLGILYGLLLNLLPVFAVTFAVSKFNGWFIGKLGLLRWAPDAKGHTVWSNEIPPGLQLAIAITGGVGVGIYALYRVIDVYRPVHDEVATRFGVASLTVLGLAAFCAALLIGVPWALATLEAAHPEQNGIDHSAQGWTLLGTVSALLGIVQRLLRKKAPQDGNSDPVTGAITQKVASIGKRLFDLIAPWVGVLIIAGLLLLAMLTWSWNVIGVIAPGPGRAAEPLRLDWPWILGAAAVCLAWQYLTDVNGTSLHRFYTSRLATAFAVTRGSRELDPPRLALSQLTEQHDKPALLVCATVNTDVPGVVPTGRGCASFTFSPYRSGISAGTMFRGVQDHDHFDLADRERGDQARRDWENAHAGKPKRSTGTLMMPTDRLEALGGRLTLIDLVGVSGAAVSPAMGRTTRASMRVLFALANIRLGMWLPNPKHVRWQKAAAPHECGNRWQRVFRALAHQGSQPGFRALTQEALGGLSLDGGWVNVTDGGHYENLGLVEALRRGATEVIVLDASGDTPFSLGALAEAVETARADLGVEITLDQPERLAQDGSTGRAHHLAARCTATYLNGVKATIYLCKAAMVDGVPQDLVTWKLDHPDFPNTSTGDQLYGDREFEAYRRLGQAAAEEALALAAPPSARRDLSGPDIRTFDPAPVTLVPEFTD